MLSLAYYGGGHYDEAAETLEYGYKLLQRLDIAKDSEVANMYDELKVRTHPGTLLSMARVWLESAFRA